MHEREIVSSRLHRRLRRRSRRRSRSGSTRRRSRPTTESQSTARTPTLSPEKRHSRSKRRSRSNLRRQRNSSSRSQRRYTRRRSKVLSSGTQKRSRVSQRSRSRLRSSSRDRRLRNTKSRRRSTHRSRSTLYERGRSYSRGSLRRRRRGNSKSPIKNTSSPYLADGRPSMPQNEPQLEQQQHPYTSQPQPNSLLNNQQRDAGIISDVAAGTRPLALDVNSDHTTGVNVIDALNKTLQAISAVTPHSKDKFATINVVPEFDPKAKNQTITVWLSKVNECAEIYGWDSKQTAHYALPKLVGTAKRWYEGQPSVIHSWEIWQDKLRAAFPTYENYGHLLTEMLNIKARFGDDLEEYYFEKLMAINRCAITGKNAIDCIVYGIEDRSVRYGAEAAGFEDTDKLLGFLRSVRHEKNDRNRNDKKIVKSNVDTYRKTQKSDQVRGTRTCFNCHEPGHVAYNCKKPIIKCQKCNRFGHNDSNCSKEILKDKSSEVKSL